MKKFTIYYKDSINRSNQADSYGKDYEEAKRKFKILYPDATIIRIE